MHFLCKNTGQILQTFHACMHVSYVRWYKALLYIFSAKCEGDGKLSITYEYITPFYSILMTLNVLYFILGANCQYFICVVVLIIIYEKAFITQTEKKWNKTKNKCWRHLLFCSQAKGKKKKPNLIFSIIAVAFVVDHNIW